MSLSSVDIALDSVAYLPSSHGQSQIAQADIATIRNIAVRKPNPVKTSTENRGAETSSATNMYGLWPSYNQRVKQL